MQCDPTCRSEIRLHRERSDPCTHDGCVNVKYRRNGERALPKFDVLGHEGECEEHHGEHSHADKEIAARLLFATLARRRSEFGRNQVHPPTDASTLSGIYAYSNLGSMSAFHPKRTKVAISRRAFVNR